MPNKLFSFLTVSFNIKTGLFSLFNLCVLAGVLALYSCNSNDKQNGNYIQEIEQWHTDRIASLKQDDSWLSLAGLYPLSEGKLTFGADSSNDIVFPPQKSVSRIGTFFVDSTRVRVEIESEVQVFTNGTSVQDTVIKSDIKGKPTVLSHGPLKWFVIERYGDRFVRLKDTEHQRLESFEGIEHFPISKKWRVKATFNEFEKPDTIKVPTELGQIGIELLYGTLEFNIDGKTYQLAPLGNPDEDEFFIIFGDETNGESTYGGGRYVYASTPNEQDITYIDFNKAYNPPCVFSPYATCPLPPAQNRLAIKITAGEKNYGDSH